jgi:hypothetical protein
VVEVTPEDGSDGVRADAEIVVTFSEPMDRVETEIAYDSSDLSPADVTFSWSAGNRKLTIHPDDGLEYSDFSPSVANPMDRIYAYAIGSSARDKAGNQLEADASFSFKMLRAATIPLPHPNATRVFHADSGSDTATESASCTSGTGSVGVGESSPTDGVGLLLTFSTADIPALEAPEDLVSATLSFDTLLMADLANHGALLVDHVDEDPASASWGTTVLESLVPARANLSRSADVSASVRADVADTSDELTQYFIHYELATDGDGMTQTLSVGCVKINLAVTYLLK